MKRLLGLTFSVVALVTFVPVHSWSATASAKIQKSSSANGSAAAHKIDLNTASKSELEALGGIGEAIADEIIAARPFRRIEELKEVKGVGEARFEKIRNHVAVSTVGPSERDKRTVSDSNEKKDPRRSSLNSAAARTRTAKVDLNTASATELQSLPGVGPATAQNILAGRPFRSVEEIKSIKGVGESRYEQIRPLVTVRGASSGSARSASGSAPASAGGSGRGALPHPGLGRGAEQKATGNTAETKININTASQQELESLLGIGPVKAKAIMDNRPYTSIEEVMKVKGVKEGTFEEMKDRIRVR